MAWVNTRSIGRKGRGNGADSTPGIEVMRKMEIEHMQLQEMENDTETAIGIQCIPIDHATPQLVSPDLC